MHFPIKYLAHYINPTSYTLFYSHSLAQKDSFPSLPTQKMASPTRTWSPQKLTILLFIFCISFPLPIIESTPSEKLDHPTDTEIKCGSCPCGNPCTQELPSPPPPPPLPPPPPPSSPPLTYFSSQNCNQSPPPPPPSPRFIYVTGVPGDVYQNEPYDWGNYHSGAQNRAVGLLVLAGLGALSVITVFG